jgi:hypothetical protein
MGAVMKVDAAGLVAAAQRLITAVAGVSGGAAHPPLAADPTSIGAAERLTTASAELSTAMSAHVLALIASLEHLMGTAVTFLETDARNAAALRTLTSAAGAAPVNGAAPPAPPIPPDVRAPLPPAAAMPAEVISAGAHAGTPGGGEGFIAAWSQAGSAAREASDHIRAAVAQLPDVLEGPVSAPAVTSHLLTFADGLQSYADRAHGLVNQAGNHSAQQHQARQAIPSPATLQGAQNRVTALANANATSGGRYSAALASAISDKNQLDQQAITAYGDYHAQTEAATAGDDSSTGDPDAPGAAPGAQPGDPATPGGTGLPGDPDTADPLAPEGADEISSLLPTMMGAMLSAAGTLTGALIKMPQDALQAGVQAATTATTSLARGGQPKMDLPKSGEPGGGDPAGMGDPGGGGADPTVPASGGGAPDLGVAPSTGGPPTPAIAPAGATPGTVAPGNPAGGMGPVGMPMGAMGGLAGAPGGGAGGGGKSDVKSDRKIQSRDVPHTEDVTGRADTNRLSVASAANRKDRNPTPPPDDDTPPDGPPLVRRLVSRQPKEDS